MTSSTVRAFVLAVAAGLVASPAWPREPRLDARVALPLSDYAALLSAAAPAAQAEPAVGRLAWRLLDEGTPDRPARLEAEAEVLVEGASARWVRLLAAGPVRLLVAEADGVPVPSRVVDGWLAVLLPGGGLRRARVAVALPGSGPVRAATFSGAAAGAQTLSLECRAPSFRLLEAPPGVALVEGASGRAEGALRPGAPVRVAWLGTEVAPPLVEPTSAVAVVHPSMEARVAEVDLRVRAPGEGARQVLVRVPDGTLDPAGVPLGASGWLLLPLPGGAAEVALPLQVPLRPPVGDRCAVLTVPVPSLPALGLAVGLDVPPGLVALPSFAAAADGRAEALPAPPAEAAGLLAPPDGWRRTWTFVSPGATALTVPWRDPLASDGPPASVRRLWAALVVEAAGSSPFVHVTCAVWNVAAPFVELSDVDPSTVVAAFSDGRRVTPLVVPGTARGVRVPLTFGSPCGSGCEGEVHLYYRVPPGEPVPVAGARGLGSGAARALGGALRPTKELGLSGQAGGYDESPLGLVPGLGMSGSPGPDLGQPFWLDVFAPEGGYVSLETSPGVLVKAQQEQAAPSGDVRRRLVGPLAVPVAGPRQAYEVAAAVARDGKPALPVLLNVVGHDAAGARWRDLFLFLAGFLALGALLVPVPQWRGTASGAGLVAALAGLVAYPAVDAGFLAAALGGAFVACLAYVTWWSLVPPEEAPVGPTRT